MDVIVSGSIAYDRIMDFSGNFADHILPEKIHVLNISFTVNKMRERFGGTAGNIAYALALLGEKPILLATVGCDCGRYFEWLEKNNISSETIKVIEDDFTACAYITTDLADNQITGFNPAAMKCRYQFDFNKINLDNCMAIVAPGNIQDMLDYSHIYKQKGVDYIFDPGQSLPLWEGKNLLSCIEGSKILISNDYELELIINKTGFNREQLLNKTKTIICTLGAMGSIIYINDCDITISPCKPDRVLDPTGAGDAYRAGLIKGIVHGESLKRSAMMGSVCASFAIENYGTQEYHFTMEQFNERLARYEEINMVC